MGKKDKKRKAAAISTSGENSTSNLPQICRIKYQDMPLNHKKKFHINDDCGSYIKYIEILSWLRDMGSYEGSVFEEIRNLNCSGGYPFLEVEVVTPQGNFTKFLITKKNLYVIAFYARNGWYQFNNTGYVVDEWAVIEKYDGSYIGSPWDKVGAKHMIRSVDTISSNKARVKGKKVSIHIKACETFFVHLAEAARLYPVQSLVCRSLMPCESMFKKHTYEDEAEALLKLRGGAIMTDEDDVLSIVKALGAINVNASVRTPECIGRLIKNYKNMSKVWYVYSLTKKKIFAMREKDVSDWHMKSRKSLRCTLAVLCNINLNKVLSEWKQKAKAGKHENFTLEDYDMMERSVHALQDQKQVFVADSP